MIIAMKIKKHAPMPISLLLLLAGLISLPAHAWGQLPKTGFPLGQSDLIETRTIRELRPGLTHVHVERGSWGPEGPPKLALIHGTRDRNENAKVRTGLENLGLKIRQEIYDENSEAGPNYVLFAGEFDNIQDAMRIVYKVPVGVQLTRLGEYKKDSGPYVIDIVILDPKKYRGKIITAWSESIWRASPLEMALKHNAVVATNGSWFEYSIDDVAGVPSGISIVEGMWHHEHYPENKRAAILFIENHLDTGPKLSIGYKPPPFPELKWGNGKSVTLDGIDRMPKLNANELVAMREKIFWHSQFSHVHPEELLSMRMISEASSGIGLFLLATGNKRAILEEIQSSWDEVKLDLSISGRPGLSALYTADILLDNGQRPKIKERHGSTARTAIGTDAEGQIYLMTVPMDTSLYESIGATFSELQDIGEFLGLVNFVNMDGGPRSTSMVIEGRPLGDPHMQIYDDERRVADSILIIDDE